MKSSRSLEGERKLHISSEENNEDMAYDGEYDDDQEDKSEDHGLSFIAFGSEIKTSNM